MNDVELEPEESDSMNGEGHAENIEGPGENFDGADDMNIINTVNLKVDGTVSTNIIGVDEAGSVWLTMGVGLTSEVG